MTRTAIRNHHNDDNEINHNDENVEKHDHDNRVGQRYNNNDNASGTEYEQCVVC